MLKENQMPARDDCPNEKMKKQVSLCGEQMKCCNEWPEISLALISLFVYFSLHLPGHVVPQCPPPLRPSLGRSQCVPMHVLSRCRMFMSICVPVPMSVRTLVSCFLLIKLLWLSDTPSAPHFSANPSRFWPFCWMHAHPHITCTRVQRQPVMDGVINCSFKGQKGP